MKPDANRKKKNRRRRPAEVSGSALHSERRAFRKTCRSEHVQAGKRAARQTRVHHSQPWTAWPSRRTPANPKLKPHRRLDAAHAPVAALLCRTLATSVRPLLSGHFRQADRMFDRKVVSGPKPAVGREQGWHRRQLAGKRRAVAVAGLHEQGKQPSARF